MKPILSIFMIIMILLSCNIAIAESNEYILGIDTSFSEAAFEKTSVTNEASKTVRESVMSLNRAKEIKQIPAHPYVVPVPVTSPDGVYTITDRELLKNDQQIKRFSFSSFIMYPGAFSPDSKFLVIPDFSTGPDESGRTVMTIAFSILSSESGNTITTYNLEIPTEDFEQRKYINRIYQVYWTSDGNAIIIDIGHREWGLDSPGTQLNYIKINIDYDHLQSSLSETPATSNTYTGPSTTNVQVTPVTIETPSTANLEQTPQEAKATPGFTLLTGSLSIAFVGISRQLRKKK